MIKWSLRIHRSVHWVANNKARSSHLRNVHIKKEHMKQNFAQNTFTLHTKTELQTAECPLTSLLTTITWLLGVCKMWPGPGPGHHQPPVTSSHGPGSARQWPGLHWTSLRPALVPAWLSGSTAWLARNCGLTKNCFLFLSQKSAAALTFECRLYTFHKTT